MMMMMMVAVMKVMMMERGREFEGGGLTAIFVDSTRAGSIPTSGNQ